ncbi:MAG: glycosyltransferase family 2 protein [Nonlabens sp.]|nr:glycosyltransferase family 2 protein [Nonlabens sp.]
MDKIVSIIIPSYNRGHCIANTLSSLTAQTYKNWECLVVDDGSDDNTAQIVEELANLDKRITWLRRPSNRTKGANACRNIGIEQSKGDYIIFLDSDDTLHEQCLQWRLQAFEQKQDVDAVVFRTGLLQTDGTAKPFNITTNKSLNSAEYSRLFLSYEIPWQITNPMWKRAVFETYGGFDEKLQRFQDVDLHTNLLLQGVKVVNVDIIDFYYRIEDELHKYQDIVFIEKATSAILAYITKYLAIDKTQVLNQHEIKAALQKMYLKTIKKFIYDKNRLTLFKTFIAFNKEQNLLNWKLTRALKMLYIVEKIGLLKIKGMGFYKLEKRLRHILFEGL